MKAPMQKIFRNKVLFPGIGLISENLNKARGERRATRTNPPAQGAGIFREIVGKVELGVSWTPSLSAQLRPSLQTPSAVH